MSWHNSHVLGGDPAAEIRALAAEDAEDIAVFAGAGAVRTTLTLGVLDELRLLVHPALVGSGTCLFGASHPPRSLRLLSTEGFDSGVVALRYAIDAVPGIEGTDGSSPAGARP